MSPHHSRPPVSDLRLEQYRLGELPPDEHRHLAARIADDATLRDRLASLDRSDRELAAAYPARDMADAIHRRATAADTQPLRTDRPRAWLGPVGLVAAAICVFAVASTVWLREPVVEDTTIKGGNTPALVLHRRVADGSEELRPGALVREGDQIRIGYRAAGRHFGAIVSIDGRGSLTAHLPRTGNESASLQPTGTVLLDFAYELDDAPRWERFYFVAAESSFELDTVRRAIVTANEAGTAAPATLSLPGTLTQFVFVLAKDHR